MHESETYESAPGALFGTDDGTVGQRIRRRRKAQHMTLKQLALKSGIAESFLSQLERGIYTGSVATLQKVSNALGLTVGDLFQENRSGAPLVSIDEIPGAAFGINARKLRLTPKNFDHVEAFVGVFEPHGSTGSEAYRHGSSEEFLVVLEGQVRLTLDSATYELRGHQSMAYSSQTPHRLEEIAGLPAKVLWVISPPSY